MNETVKRWEALAAERLREQDPSEVDIALESAHLAISELDKAYGETSTDINQLLNHYPELNSATKNPLSARDCWYRVVAEGPHIHARYSQLIPVLDDAGERVAGMYVRVGQFARKRSYEVPVLSETYFYDVVNVSLPDRHVVSSAKLEKPSSVYEKFLNDDPTATGDKWSRLTPTEKLGKWAVTNQFLAVNVQGISEKLTETSTVVKAALLSAELPESGLIDVVEQERLALAKKQEEHKATEEKQQHKRGLFGRSKK